MSSGRLSLLNTELGLPAKVWRITSIAEATKATYLLEIEMGNQ
jgi:hypothetical protein